MAGFMVITGPGAGMGFGCAGVETRELPPEGDLSGLLLELQAGGKYGIVVVDERLLEKVPDNVMRRITKKGLPVIVPARIPSRWDEREAAEAPVMRLIRKAIGYQIKIKR